MKITTGLLAIHLVFLCFHDNISSATKDKTRNPVLYFFDFAVKYAEKGYRSHLATTGGTTPEKRKSRTPLLGKRRPAVPGTGVVPAATARAGTG
jgi:hypothetical protein